MNVCFFCNEYLRFDNNIYTFCIKCSTKFNITNVFSRRNLCEDFFIQFRIVINDKYYIDYILKDIQYSKFVKGNNVYLVQVVNNSYYKHNFILLNSVDLSIQSLLQQANKYLLIS